VEIPQEPAVRTHVKDMLGRVLRMVKADLGQKP
jgi:hypothetical protein